MAFKFDPRDFPDNLKSNKAKKEFKNAVLDRLNDPSGGITKTSPLFAAVVGMLVLDGETDPESSTFESAFWTVRGEAAGSTVLSSGKKKDNSDIYNDVATEISGFPGHNGTVYFQELAHVSRKLLANTTTIPADDPTFSSQIRVYDDEYVADGPRAAGGLSIPDLTSAGSTAAPDDIRRPNIEAVAHVLPAYYLEQARLFDVVDRIIETWWNGQLPVGADSRIKTLDDFFWSSEFRLTPAARHMQYSRVLGSPGGEVSTEVQPNLPFMDALQRFVANLAEYDRQQRVGDIVGNQRRNALSLTSELVRQSGRNLAANASLYGWGGTQFAARRLSDHVTKAFEIINIPAVQAAYGVDGPWKVVERVAQELGAVPNIVKWRTMATAGNKILLLVAKHSRVWSGSTGKPLFADMPTTQLDTIDTMGKGVNAVTAELHQLTEVIEAATTLARGAPPATPLNKLKTISTKRPASVADISDDDRDELIRQAGNYIAVLGIRDDAVEQLSQPVETQFAPSIPSLTTAAPSTNGQAGLDQLRAMVSQGQVPSLDQLKNLVMPVSG